MKMPPISIAATVVALALSGAASFGKSITVSPSKGSYKAAGVGAEYDHEHTALDKVLKAYVTGEAVRYRALKLGQTDLKAWLKSAGDVTSSEFSKWTEQQQLAFLINLYNAATLKLIVDNYPIKSIKKIGGLFSGPWDQPVVKLHGKVITLDTLEHKILRTQYNEPRIHFAIVCAAKGCPPLLGGAYTAEKLEAQLEAQGRTFLGTKSKNHVSSDGKTLYLSPIFKWFKEDFTKNGSVASYVKPYLPENSAAKLKSKPKIKYTDYDWSLNDAG